MELNVHSVEWPAARAGAALLEVRDVSKRFGAFEALREVSLSITPGSVVGLVGPNGAGKTTLLSILSGLLRPDSGRLTFAGLGSFDEVPTAAKRLFGYVPDSQEVLGYL